MNRKCTCWLSFLVLLLSTVAAVAQPLKERASGQRSRTIAARRALAVAPTPFAYLPHSRAGRAEATNRTVAAPQMDRRGRARVWREVGRPQRSEGGRVRGNPTETRAQAALTLGSMGSSAIPYVGDYGSAFLSVVNFGAFPSWANFVDACLDCAGAALPAVGPAGTLRRVERFGGVGEDLAGAGEDIQRFARGFGEGGSVPIGGSSTFYHGTTASGAESIVGGLRPVSTATGQYPPGSFFTHEASLPNALEASSHWPIVQGKTNSLGVRVVEITVPNSTLRSLEAEGLIRIGPVPGLPGFPAETVFAPGALDALNQAGTFRIISGSF